MEHVPAFSVFTEEPLTLQILEDEDATVMTTFEDEANEIFAFVARHVFEIVLPFFTVQFDGVLAPGVS